MQTTEGSPAQVQSPGRALIVKFGSIGDVVMAIPAAAALHGQGFAIDWVVSETIAPVLALYPWIHVVPVNEGTLLRGGLPGRLQAAAALWQTLRARTRRQGAYHLLATLYYDRRYDLLTRGIPARRRLQLSATDRRLTLLAGRHHTDEYARILLGRDDGECPMQYAPLPVAGLPLCPRPPAAGHPRVVLVPGGARNVLRDDALRRWPADAYVALARLLLESGFEVILAGGPDDRWVSPQFAGLAGGAGSGAFADLIGSLDLVSTLALLDSATVCVTHDTGPLHLAGLTRTAIVSIFGPTDPHGRLPRRENAVALWGGEGFACRPCYDGREYAPCLHNGCMSQVTPSMVFTEVHRLYEAVQTGNAIAPQVLAPPPAPPLQIRFGGIR